MQVYNATPKYAPRCDAYSFSQQGYIRPNRVSKVPDPVEIRDQPADAPPLME